MKRTIGFVVALFTGLLLILALFVSAAGAKPVGTRPAERAAPVRITEPHVPGELLVKLRPGVTLRSRPGKRPTSGVRELDALLADRGVREARPVFAPVARRTTAQIARARQIGLDRWYRLRLPIDADLPAVLAALRADRNVEVAEPNYNIRASETTTATVTPDDPYFFQQWGLTQIGAKEAWAIEQGSAGFTIAILDTGLDLNHPDLAGRLWVNPGETAGNGLDDDANGYVDDVNGWNFVENNNLPQDDSGHGTHVAGIAAANGNNATGIAGVDWNARIMPLRILNAGGAGTHAAAAAALQYAADKGAQVINMSFGAYADAQVLRDAVAYASQTALLVGAAGNDGRDSPFYPAAYPQVMAVAATGPGDVKTAFSNHGTWVDIAAPGETIWSTVYDDDYVGWSGTSMAAPFVSGAASLVWAHNPTLTPGSVRRHLLNTAADVDTPNPAYTGLLGSGRLDLFAALNTAPRPRLEIDGYAVDGVTGGHPEPNTTVNLTVTLANTWADATAITGTLSTTDTHVTIGTATASFGDIAGDASGANGSPFVLTLDATTPFNTPIPFRLTLQAGGGYSTTLPLTLTTASSIQNLSALTINSDTTWTTDRQYVIGGAVRVLQGVTLTVEPGTVVQFEPAGSLTVSGTLIADGTAAAPILFEGTGAGAWGGLTFTDVSVDATFDITGTYQSGSILRHVQVLSATTGVRLQNAAPYIAQSRFAGHVTTALAVDGSSPQIIANSFVSNTIAITLSNGSLAHIEDNVVVSNTTGIAGSGVALTVQGNEIRDNTTGLDLHTSGATTVQGNLIAGNGTGAALAPGWPTGNRTNPDVAYNSARDEYLVVWEDARDASSRRIYGQRLSGEGALTGGEIGLAASGDNYGPRLAYDPVGDAYLALWRQSNGISNTLAGQMIASDGTLSGTLFAIATFTGTQSSYALAANTTSGGYLVVWNDAADEDYDVYAQLITASGQLTGTRLTVIADSTDQLDVAVAYNAKTNEYLIVWAEQGLYSGWDLYGRRLRANGTFASIPFTVSAVSPSNERHPAVAAETTLGWYTVVWDDDRNGRYDIYGRRLTSTGGATVWETQIFAAPPDVTDYGYPHIIFSATSNEHVVLWTETWATGDIVGQRVSASGGLVVSGNKFNLTTDAAHQGLGGATYNTSRNELLAVWRDMRDSSQTIYGQRFSPTGVLLDNSGSSRDESNPGVNFPIVLGAGFTHNTVAGNGTGLSVNATDPDLLVTSDNNLLRNTTYNVANGGSGTLNLTHNCWGITDTAQISATINGAAVISPVLTVPDSTAPAILWRLFFATASDPTPQPAVEGSNYGPVGAEQLDITLDFSKPMDTGQTPFVTIGTGSESLYTPTHLIRFGQWISSTRWLGSYMVDWYTGDGVKRVSVEQATGADDGFAAPTDRRFTFEVSILAASSTDAQPGWNQVVLSWQPANLSTLAGYHVYRSNTSGGPYTRLNASIVTGTRYTDTTVTNNHTYYYKVNAVNTDLSERDYTNEVAATPGDATPPTTPVVTDDGDYTNSTTTLHATWSATDPESGIVEYQFRIGTTPGGGQVVGWTSVGTATEVTRSGLHLTNGATYYFSVKARNSGDVWSAVGTSDGITVNTSWTPSPTATPGGSSPTPTVTATPGGPAERRIYLPVVAKG
jgi:subtilisin family serine protease